MKRFPTRDLPVSAPVEVRWNEYSVPYVVAKTDGDGAFALGMVHSHLRGGQMELFRRITQGRLSEIAGPLAVDIDHALRILDFGRVVNDIERGLPPETREWLERFTEGVNYYRSQNTDEPPEWGLMGISFEPWSVRDVLLISRLAGTDVTWLAYGALLQSRRNEPNFPALWKQIVSLSQVNAVSFASTESKLDLSSVLANTSRSGSNSIVVAGSRTNTGAALMANDPHLGVQLPNFWILAGLRSPSYQVVGFMIPGLPIFGVGRNPHIAWGGTNMRAASSDIVRVRAEDLAEEKTTIKNRFWFDSERTVRRSARGPVISDAERFKGNEGELLALKWVGHLPSDEVTAFLRASRSTSFTEFRRAFATFAVSAQNMLYADTRGNIGQVMAAWLPARDGFPSNDFVFDEEKASRNWDRILTVLDLPAVYNPASHFIASANNRPTATGVPLSFFYSDDERVLRLQKLLSERQTVTVADLQGIQMDVVSDKARLLSELFAREAKKHLLGNGETINLLATWDGSYGADATPPVAFEAILTSFARALYADENGDVPRHRQQWTILFSSLMEDIPALSSEQGRALFEEGFQKASKALERYPTWGDMHRQRIAHALAGIPVLGRLFVEGDFGASGSRETIMKTAHQLTDEKHRVTYGSQSRHVSDLSSPDENYFVLFGGQDGFLGSENYADQIPLWREGRMIRMPLSPALIENEFLTTP